MCACCMYVCICVCMCTYVYIYTYIYIYVCALYVYVCIHIYVCMTHMCVYVYMYVYIYVYIYIFILHIPACLLACLLASCLSLVPAAAERMHSTRLMQHDGIDEPPWMYTCSNTALCDLYNIFIVAESATITESADLSFHDIPARRRIFPSLLLLVCPRTGALLLCPIGRPLKPGLRSLRE